MDKERKGSCSRQRYIYGSKCSFSDSKKSSNPKKKDKNISFNFGLLKIVDRSDSLRASSKVSAAGSGNLANKMQLLSI